MQDKPGAITETSPCNCQALRQAARHVSQIYDAHLTPHRLRASQYSVLRTLDLLGPLSINGLAKAMVMDRTTLGRALGPLARDGLLAIGAGSDARTRSLSLTPDGTARLAAAAVGWREAQLAFENAFGREDAAGLRAALRRVVATT